VPLYAWQCLILTALREAKIVVKVGSPHITEIVIAISISCRGISS
jgi:hypothetical protein